MTGASSFRHGGRRWRVQVIHGPSLDRLGRRPSEHYGHATLEEVNAALDELAGRLGVELRLFQSASEGALVERIHAACDEGADGLLVNAAAYTHTSVALRDAIEASGLPAVEVHLSHVFAREPFRHASMLAPVCLGTIAGFGLDSYLLGLRALFGYLETRLGARG